jgi:hypothetical protein
MVVKLSIIGLHRIHNAPEPCHLIELRIDDCAEVLDLAFITQEVADQPRSNWQVPYDEHLLGSDGGEGAPCTTSSSFRPGPGARLAFFFHYLDVARPLLTPAGPLVLPEETPIPRRLAFMKYEQP